MKVEVAALGSLSPIVLTVCVNVKQHLKKKKGLQKCSVSSLVIIIAVVSSSGSGSSSSGISNSSSSSSSSNSICTLYLVCAYIYE